MNKTLNLQELKEMASLVRQDVIEMLTKAGSGHAAGSLGISDVLVALYFSVLNVDSNNFSWSDRDRFLLSAGHLCPALYAALARAGFFPREELLSLRKLGSRLQGHPSRVDLPGIEISSGPLGQGVSQAVGMAVAGKMDYAPWRVYCLMSDGEQQEGQVWEALMFAGNRSLDNLTFVLDRNEIQISGSTEDVMPLEPLVDKYNAFGLAAFSVDGHDFSEIISAFSQAREIRGQPTVVITHTIAGKGVSFMEGKSEWHGKAPNKEQLEEALKELKSSF
jgi:transketolase